MKPLADALVEVKAAHDKLSEACEDPEGSNDAEHDAAVELLLALNDYYVEHKTAMKSLGFALEALQPLVKAHDRKATAAAAELRLMIKAGGRAG